MYTSPIEMVLSDLVSDYVKKADEYIVACVQQVGVKVDKDELVKALEFDRKQYEKGWNDRDAEIVRCKDCKHNSLGRFLGNTYCDLGIGLYQLDNFCSRGERREDDNK